jgi:hypothetical protein
MPDIRHWERQLEIEDWVVEGEKKELLNALTAGRKHVLGILEGLSSEALHRALCWVW